MDDKEMMTNKKKNNSIVFTMNNKQARTKSSVVSSKSKRQQQKPRRTTPQRPLTAYNVFFKETRKQLLTMKERRRISSQRSSPGETAPAADFQPMVREIASRWKILSEEERNRYGMVAKEDMKRYKHEMKTYAEQMAMQQNLEKEHEEDIIDVWEEKNNMTTAPPPVALEQVVTPSNRSNNVHLLAEVATSPGVDRTVSKDTMDRRGSKHAPSIPESARGAVRHDWFGSFPRPPSSQDELDARELDRLIAEEIKAIDLVCSAKTRQIRLVRQLQSTNPYTQVLASLDAQRHSLGLAPLLAVEGQYGELAPDHTTIRCGWRIPSGFEQLPCVPADVGLCQVPVAVPTVGVNRNMADPGDLELATRLVRINDAYMRDLYAQDE